MDSDLVNTATTVLMTRYRMSADDALDTLHVRARDSSASLDNVTAGPTTEGGPPRAVRPVVR